MIIQKLLLYLQIALKIFTVLPRKRRWIFFLCSNLVNFNLKWKYIENIWLKLQFCDETNTKNSLPFSRREKCQTYQKYCLTLWVKTRNARKVVELFLIWNVWTITLIAVAVHAWWYQILYIKLILWWNFSIPNFPEIHLSDRV